MHRSFLALSSLLGAIAIPALLGAQTTQRVSVSSTGLQSNGPSLGPGAIAASGQFVAFTGNASNLVAGDTNNAADAFVHDRASGMTERVSVSTAGLGGNQSCGDPRVSADGARVAFIGSASNLVSGDTNGADDIFLRDRVAGTTTRVSVSSAGAQASGASGYVALSADGNWVAFASAASNLTPSDTNAASDVFVHDVPTATTTRVSVATGGVQSNGSSNLPALSADGRYVVFTSLATNLAAGDTNGVRDVFVHDRVAATTVLVSVDSSGALANGASGVGIQGPATSLDGRVVAFSSSATNLVASDTNALTDVFVHDLISGATSRVSVDSAGFQGNGESYFPSLSADGRYVVFSSNASNLVAADTNGNHDVFLHDRASGATSRVSVASTGFQAVGNSSPTLPPSISADGRSIGFDSGAANLVTGDTNGAWDVFVHDRYAAPLVYCTSGTSAGGCAASISASAQPDVAGSSGCTVLIDGVDGQRVGIVFYGLTALVQPWCPAGGGTSFLCVKPPTQRSGPQSSGGTAGLCDGALALDWHAFQSASPGALGNPWSAGSKAFVQGWFRDPASCKTTALSDALELTYVP
jgi:Tol biopolymer transport system component